MTVQCVQDRPLRLEWSRQALWVKLPGGVKAGKALERLKGEHKVFQVQPEALVSVSPAQATSIDRIF